MSYAYVDPWDMLNNFCFHIYAQKSLFHFHTLSLSHSRTLTLSHSLIHSLSTCWTTFVFMSMLKSHYFWQKLQCGFLDSSSSSITLSTDIRVSRAGSQLKREKILIENNSPTKHFYLIRFFSISRRRGAAIRGYNLIFSTKLWGRGKERGGKYLPD